MRPRAIPLTLKVPALAAGLMIVVSTIVSWQVMARLVEGQERQLRDLAGAYMDGLSSSVIPHVLRADLWEIYDALDRAGALYGAVRPMETVVVDATGTVLAASDPAAVPSLQPVPALYADRLGDARFAIDPDRGHAFVRRPLAHRETPVGAILAKLDIRPLLAERREVILTLVLTNALLTLVFAAAGYLAVRRMVKPMRVLADHLSTSAEGEAEPIPEARLPARGTEARGLFEAFNRLAESQRESRALSRRLAEEERIGSLGRLASALAHEINNPLGGLFTAVDALKRHGDDPATRRSALGLVERGLSHIRDVVAAALQTYRPERTPHAFGPEDVEDVRLLAGPECRRRRVALSWRSAIDAPLDLPGAPVRQALLNLVLNAAGAAPEGSRVRVELARRDGALAICVCDAGSGLPAEAARLLETPDAAAPIGAADGLGLWVVRRLVTDLGGTIACDRCAAGGARVRLTLPLAAARPREAADAAA